MNPIPWEKEVTVEKRWCGEEMQNPITEFRYLEGRQKDGTQGNWHTGRGEGVCLSLHMCWLDSKLPHWWSQAPWG